MKTPLLLAILALLLAAFTPAGAATKTWTGAVNNNWHEPGNWSPSGVPAGNATINIVGGSIDATPPVTIASGGTVNWTGPGHAYLYGGLTIASGGALNVGLDDGYYLHFYGGVTNAGTLRCTNGILYVGGGNGGVIVNQPGGLIDVQSENGISGDGLASLLNAGTFRKSAGSGTTTVSVPLTNTGIVQALSGTLSLNGGGAFQGTFHAAAGAAIQLGGGAFTYSTLPTFTGPGAIQLNGATLTLLNNTIPGLQMISGTVILGPAFQGGTITNLSLGAITLNGNHTVSGTLNGSGISGDLTIASGATVSLSGGSSSGNQTVASGGTLNLSGGSLSGQHTIASGGTVNWTGPGHAYLYGGLTIASGGALNVGLDDGYYLHFYGGVTNAGTLRCTNGILYVGGGNGGVIVNQPGGLIDVQSENGISGDGLASLLNAGTFRKSAGSGTTTVSVPLTNTGIVQALSGTLSLNGGGAFQGTFHAAAGAAIQLGGGAFTYSTLPTFTGPGAIQLNGATLTLLNNTIPGLQMISGTVILGPAFQGGTITNLSLGAITLNGNHTVSGTLNGSGISGDLTIASGATVSLSGGSSSGNQTVASGGTLNLSGGSLSGQHTIASGGTVNWTGPGHAYLYGGLTIASGGALNVGLDDGYYLHFYGGVTNAGTLRCTNGILYVGGGNGGVIVNQPGGLIDVQSENGISGDGLASLLNAGTFRKSAGSGTTTVSVPLTNTGIVQALSGTLSLNGGGAFQGTFHAAAGAAIQLGGGAFTYSTLPTFTGPGAIQLNGATLTLLNNTIPGLQMISGTVILGPAFQGGTITNLSLGAITLNGNHTVSGTLNGSGISGDLTIASGATVSLSGGSSSGNQTVASGGTLNLSGGSLSGQHTIASGGTVNWTGPGHAYLYGGLTIASGGALNVGLDDGYYLHFYGGVTNAGTLRCTNGILYVGGGNGGVIVNQPGGLIDVQSENGISGDGLASLLNAGTFRKSAGSGTTTVSVPLTNTGIVQALSGTISFQGPFTNEPSATLAISIGGAAAGTDYGHLHFADPLALTGSFTASTRNGYLPNPGDTFNALSYPSFTGEFTCLSGINLGGGIVLFPAILPKGMTLTAASSAPNAPAIFAMRWAGGVRLLRPPGFSDWEFVTTTNLFAPVWTPVPSTGCDQATLPVTAPQQYFRLRKNN